MKYVDEKGNEIVIPKEKEPEEKTEEEKPTQEIEEKVIKKKEGKVEKVTKYIDQTTGKEIEKPKGKKLPKNVKAEEQIVDEKGDILEEEQIEEGDIVNIPKDKQEGIKKYVKYVDKDGNQVEKPEGDVLPDNVKKIVKYVDENGNPIQEEIIQEKQRRITSYYTRPRHRFPCFPRR